MRTRDRVGDLSIFLLVCLVLGATALTGCVDKERKSGRGTVTGQATRPAAKGKGTTAPPASTGIPTELIFVRIKREHRELGVVDLHVGQVARNSVYQIKTPTGKVHKLKQDKLSPRLFTLEMPLRQFVTGFPNGKYIFQVAGASAAKAGVSPSADKKGAPETDTKKADTKKTDTGVRGTEQTTPVTPHKVVRVSGEFPAYVIPVAPGPGATGLSRRPTFSWKVKGDVGSYALSIEDQKTGKHIMSKDLGKSTTSLRLSAKQRLKANTGYVLFLEAINPRGHRGSIIAIPFTTGD